MTWTYSLSDLSTSEKDQIRLEVADNDSTKPLLADEEILYAITVERNFWSAAARCAEMIARHFFRFADEVRLGRALQLQHYRRAKQYMDMAIALRRKALGTIVPYVGGISVTDKQTFEQNTDLVQPAFARTMMENPRTGGYTSDTLDAVGGEQIDTGNI